MPENTVDQSINDSDSEKLLRDPAERGAVDALAFRAKKEPKQPAENNTMVDSPTPQVSNIAQSILSELDRVRGTTITLTLDIDAETTDGFPEDVETHIRDNAASLRIADFGFEGE